MEGTEDRTHLEPGELRSRLSTDVQTLTHVPRTTLEVIGGMMSVTL